MLALTTPVPNDERALSISVRSSSCAPAKANLHDQLISLQLIHHGTPCAPPSPVLAPLRGTPFAHRPPKFPDGIPSGTGVFMNRWGKRLTLEERSRSRSQPTGEGFF